MGFLDNLFNMADKKELKKFNKIVDTIDSLEPKFESMSDKELKQLIADKYMVMKTKKVISLKPVEDKFKERIEKYMNQIKEVRLK